MRLIITQSTPRTDALRDRLAARGHSSFLLPFSAIVDSPSAPDAEGLRAAVRDSDCVIPVSPTAIERMLSAWRSAGPVPSAGQASSAGPVPSAGQASLAGAVPSAGQASSAGPQPSAGQASLAGPASSVGQASSAVPPSSADAASPWPPGVELAVVGPGSVRALAEGLPAPVLARVIQPAGPPYDAQRLIAEPAFAQVAGRRVLVLRGESGNDRWIEALRDRGAIVTVVALYRNAELTPDDAQRRALVAWLAAALSRDDPAAAPRLDEPALTPRPDEGAVAALPPNAVPPQERGLPDADAPPPLWWFSHTGNAVRCCEWLRATGQSAVPAAHHALAIHPRIARALADQGWQRVSLIEPGEAALLAEIESSG